MERENGMFCPRLGGNVEMCVCSETPSEIDRGGTDEVANHLGENCAGKVSTQSCCLRSGQTHVHHFICEDVQ